ncbi:phenylacetate-CoA oxygenase subunit PaaC [Bacteroidia bacterium]|nr:phenylacetate-CoA oxygenase subunit PaaC [Bacteroidia bacterium]MDB9882517.1 phenylacetate-CoA oxygenase subunit PaaC [Bacteroidia bacterium]
MNNITALKELLYKIADDQLIIGHRNSEWTGLGPILEEDIAFSSMAQDKIGQSEHIYNLLHQLGEAEPDTVAFTRNAEQFHNSQLTELPIGEYDFSLLRHFLFDFAEYIRFGNLRESSYQPLAQVAKKFYGEIKYHTMHANTWIYQLGTGTQESHDRMQNVLDNYWNTALGMFEEGPAEELLISEGIFMGEKALRGKWLEVVMPLLEKSSLKVPEADTWEPIVGGRTGKHTEHLQPLLSEMTEVYAIDPSADW